MIGNLPYKTGRGRGCRSGRGLEIAFESPQARVPVFWRPGGGDDLAVEADLEVPAATGLLEGGAILGAQLRDP
jgi:hypothetical protein